MFCLSAIANSDDFVTEALITFDKFPVIIHELLLIELWNENILPLIKDRVNSRNSMRV